MTTGISLHIGLNAVDPTHYQGWSGQLTACELDAADMAMIAKSCGFETTTLLTNTATRNAVIDSIVRCSKTLKSGDIFFLTYSGHGGQVPDSDGDEDDGEDETWCLFDGQWIDDEIYFHFGSFAEGVRVFVLSDSCHSGTVLRNALFLQARTHGDTSLSEAAAPYKCMPKSVALRTYLANKKFYDKIGTNARYHDARAKIKASA